MTFFNYHHHRSFRLNISNHASEGSLYEWEGGVCDLIRESHHNPQVLLVFFSKEVFF